MCGHLPELACEKQIPRPPPASAVTRGFLGGAALDGSDQVQEIKVRPLPPRPRPRARGARRSLHGGPEGSQLRLM